LGDLGVDEYNIKNGY